MNTVKKDTHQIVTLEAYQMLTLIAAEDGTGTLWRLSDAAGGEPGRPTAIATSATVNIGPFVGRTRHDLVVTTGSIDWTSAPVDYPTLAEAVAGAGTASLIQNDILELVGSGAPVDYTDGDPVATGGRAGLAIHRYRRRGALSQHRHEGGAGLDATRFPDCVKLPTRRLTMSDE